MAHKNQSFSIFYSTRKFYYSCPSQTWGLTYCQGGSGSLLKIDSTWRRRLLQRSSLSLWPALDHQLFPCCQETEQTGTVPAAGALSALSQGASPAPRSLPKSLVRAAGEETWVSPDSLPNTVTHNAGLWLVRPQGEPAPDMVAHFTALLIITNSYELLAGNYWCNACSKWQLQWQWPCNQCM